MLPLICIDVDGTLVGASGEPTEAVWAAAHAAIDRNQHLALTTARGAFGPTWDWATRLDPAGWHIFHAGAALVHTGSGDVIEQPLPDEAVHAAATAADANGWTVEFYSAADYRVTRESPEARDHAALMGVGARAGSAAELPGAVVRAQFVIAHDQVASAATAMTGLAEVSTATSPVQPGMTFMSLTAHGATKASAIERIAAELGTSMDKVMMVGDGHNDVAAVAATGHGTAMGNAESEVKAVATHHVASVADDGLAEALELSATL